MVGGQGWPLRTACWQGSRRLSDTLSDKPLTDSLTVSERWMVSRIHTVLTAYFLVEVCEIVQQNVVLPSFRISDYSTIRCIEDKVWWSVGSLTNLTDVDVIVHMQRKECVFWGLVIRTGPDKCCVRQIAAFVCWRSVDVYLTGLKLWELVRYCRIWKWHTFLEVCWVM